MGGIPRGVVVWLGVLGAASLAGWYGGDGVTAHLALAPAKIWHGEVWRLVTWPLVSDNLYALGLTLWSVRKFGSRLAARWTTVWVVVAATTVLVLVGVVTSLVALAIPSVWSLSHLGGYELAWVLLLGCTRALSDAMRFRTHQVLLVGLAICGALGAAFGFAGYVPQVVAMLLVAVFPIP